MTVEQAFQQWWLAPGEPFEDEEQAARSAWEAAIKQEREACAKLCADYAIKHAKDDDNTKAQAWMMLQCAASIRARSPSTPVQGEPQ